MIISCIILAGQIFLISDQSIFALPEGGSYGFYADRNQGAEYSTLWIKIAIPEANIAQIETALRNCRKVGKND